MFSLRAAAGRPVLYHLHVPKAAGTTLFNLLRSRFARWNCCPVRRSAIDLVRIPRARFARYDLVGGHLQFGYHLPEYMGRPVRAVTMLREPRAHLLSLYKQVMQEPLDPIRAYVDAHCPTVEAFFFDPLVSEYVRDMQTRFLAVTERQLDVAALERIRTAAPGEVPGIVEAAAGRRPPLSGPELLDRARRRLDGCLSVGFVERFDESLARLCGALGWAPFARVKSSNVSAVRVADGGVSARVFDRIDELTALDRALYDAARDRFEKESAASVRRRAA